MTTIKLNANHQPPTGIHFTNNEIKAVNTLYGIIIGITADGVINENEFSLLNIWLLEHEFYTGAFPLNVVKARVDAILADGQVTPEELANLNQSLSEIIGGTFQATGSPGGVSGTFNTIDPEHIEFNGATFCLTGGFVYGTRDKCEEAITSKGGVPVKTITKDLDYLVIGSFASRDWVGTSHGRKIEKALHYQNKGNPVVLLTEETWFRFL